MTPTLRNRSILESAGQRAEHLTQQAQIEQIMRIVPSQSRQLDELRGSSGSLQQAIELRGGRRRSRQLKLSDMSSPQTCTGPREYQWRGLFLSRGIVALLGAGNDLSVIPVCTSAPTPQAIQRAARPT